MPVTFLQPTVNSWHLHLDSSRV